MIQFFKVLIATTLASSILLSGAFAQASSCDFVAHNLKKLLLLKGFNLRSDSQTVDGITVNAFAEKKILGLQTRTADSPSHFNLNVSFKNIEGTCYLEFIFVNLLDFAKGFQSIDKCSTYSSNHLPIEANYTVKYESSEYTDQAIFGLPCSLIVQALQ